MDFISSNLPLILCSVVGFGLLMVEAFMPGFGVAGISGIVLEVIAIYSAWVHHGTMFALIMTVIILAVVGVTVYLSYRSVVKGRLSKSNLILKDTEIPVPETVKPMSAYLNREAVAVSALRPGGTVEIDGVKVNAASSGDLIEKGTRVRVTGTEGDHVVVRPADQA